MALNDELYNRMQQPTAMQPQDSNSIWKQLLNRVMQQPAGFLRQGQTQQPSQNQGWSGQGFGSGWPKYINGTEYQNAQSPGYADVARQRYNQAMANKWPSEPWNQSAWGSPQREAEKQKMRLYYGYEKPQRTKTEKVNPKERTATAPVKNQEMRTYRDAGLRGVPEQRLGSMLALPQEIVSRLSMPEGFSSPVYIQPRNVYDLVQAMRPYYTQQASPVTWDRSNPQAILNTIVQLMGGNPTPSGLVNAPTVIY